MEIEDFAETIARPDLVLAGGSVAAHAGSFAAALGEMMAGLSEGRPKFAEHDLLIREIHKELTEARNVLKNLATEDSVAFRSVLIARRLSRNTNSKTDAGAEAIESAMKDATETPLRNARAAFRVLELLRVLIEIGNINARTDAAIGAQLAYASLKSAQYNVLTNIPGISDRVFAENCRLEVMGLDRKAQGILRLVNSIIEGS
jgi:formiminotetrahydrofolate cyclodeaminase